MQLNSHKTSNNSLLIINNQVYIKYSVNTIYMYVHIHSVTIGYK